MYLIDISGEVKVFPSISHEFAAGAMLFTMAAFVFFHVLVLTGRVPQDIVWGGRMKSREELVRFEVVSIAILIVSTLIVGFRYWSLSTRTPSVLATIGIWVLVVLFALNTIGNLFAKTKLEKYLFTPVTLVSSLACLQLALA